jgi:NAD(P)-dependent dehydrogenase (short-subunit alcohol dehydrogenase family)
MRAKCHFSSYFQKNNDPMSNGTALVIGSQGGLGRALLAQLQRDASYAQVLGLSRSSDPAIDYSREDTLAQAATWLQAACTAQPLRTVIVATGHLHSGGSGPERSLAQLDATYLQRVMLINAIGPALLLKHLAPLLPREGLLRLAGTATAPQRPRSTSSSRPRVSSFRANTNPWPASHCIRAQSTPL